MKAIGQAVVYCFSSFMHAALRPRCGGKSAPVFRPIAAVCKATGQVASPIARGRPQHGDVATTVFHNRVEDCRTKFGRSLLHGWTALWIRNSAAGNKSCNFLNPKKL